LRVGESEPSSNRGDELKFEFIERVNPSSNSDSAPLVREAAGLAAASTGADEPANGRISALA
jgi:hypothetical protein